MPARRSDEELMMEAARGSTAAFEEIVGRYQAKVLNLFCFLAGDRESAKDLTQDCFLKLLRNAPTYRVRAKFSTYLFTIARRLAFDEKAKAWTRKRGPMPVDLPSPGRGPDEEVERIETYRKLAAALETLPEKEREALVLSEAADLSYAEIAEVAGCPEGTVASRKNRALRLLRMEWGDRER